MVPISLDLGSLVGEVRLDATLFETTYVRVVKQMADLGARAGAAAAGTSRLDRSLAQAGASANTAAAGLGRAQSALAGTGVSASDAAVATSAVATSTTEASLASSRLTQALLRQSAAQARLAALEESGTATDRQLAMARASLLAANDRAALSTERLGKATGFTSQTWQSAGRGMVVAGGLIAAGMVIAGKAAADFDAKMALVRTLSKASPADMAQLRGAALSVGQAYGYTAGQVADAEAELVKAGLSVKDIMGGALAGALTLAAAGQEDVAQATNTAAVAMTQFRLSGKDVPHIADLLASGADKALGSVADLSEALSYGGVAAAQAGMSIEETVGVLAELAQSGQLGSIAGSQLAMMLRNLEAPGAKAKAEMKDLGIAVYGGNGQMLSMATIVGELHDKIGKLPPAQRDAALAALFSARSIRAANILMRDGADGVREWTKRVDDSGFAALQASGKLNSLSGDFIKLKAALGTALIGAGENAQGPLRSIAHDLTDVINAWNALPGPVKTGVEALTGVVGVTLLIGGGMLLLLPRIQKTRQAMDELGISGSRVGGILGKGGLLLAGITAATAAVSMVDDAMHHTSINADAMSASLEHLARTGRVTGEITRAFGSDLSKLKSTVSLSGQGFDVFGFKFHSLSQTFSHSGGDFADSRNKINAVDQALADMVTSGHADDARTAYDQLSAAAKRQGVSVATLAARFPQYSGAVRASAASAANAANGVDKYGNAVGAAAAKTKSATDAAKDYANALHAQADPLFAMNQALSDLRDKQATATADLKKYGAAGRQTKQAQLDVASSALDVAAAAKTLAASVKDGTTSLSGAKQMLHEWVAAGIITRGEATQIARSFGGIIDKAQHVAGALDKSAADFKRAGADAARGFAEGISAGEYIAMRAAAHMGDASYHAARIAIHSASPSKLFAKLGKSVPDGYVLGIKAGMPMVVMMGKALSGALADGFLQGQPQVVSAFKDGAASGLAAMAQVVAGARTQLSTDLQSRAQASAGIASGLTGAYGLSNAIGPYGNVLNLSQFLGAGAHALHTDKTLLARLKTKHLSAGLLAEIAGLSPQQAIAEETSILSGASGKISTINRNFAAVNRYAGQIGDAIAVPQFAHTIAHDRAQLAEARETNHLLRNLIATLLKTHPKITGKELAAALEQVIKGHQVHHR